MRAACFPNHSFRVFSRAPFGLIIPCCPPARAESRSGLRLCSAHRKQPNCVVQCRRPVQPLAGRTGGYIIPPGSGAVIYQDALLWRGLACVDEAYLQPTPLGRKLRVGGGAYKIATQRRAIYGFGAHAVAANTVASESRTYRICRTDFARSDEALKKDAAAVFEYDTSAMTLAHPRALCGQ